MSTAAHRLVEIVRAQLGDAVLAKSIVYLSTGPLQAGLTLECGDVAVEAPWNADVVFVDLAPEANWGHACCYFAIRVDADEALRFPAQMPPFLKAGSASFRLLWRGPHAPEWAVGTEPE
jgi:hypothetical protein